MSMDTNDAADVTSIGAVAIDNIDDVQNDVAERGEQILLAPYVNPEFFTPKEISNMLAGFTVQIFLSMSSKPGAKIENAFSVAVDIVSFSINNDTVREAFVSSASRRRMSYDVLSDSRTRMDELLKQQNASGFGE